MFTVPFLFPVRGIVLGERFVCDRIRGNRVVELVMARLVDAVIPTHG